jgi:hypothetical protein
MNWFYFRDDSTGAQVRWDREEHRVRIIDPIDLVLVNQVGISLSEVIRLCSSYLKRKPKDE